MNLDKFWCTTTNRNYWVSNINCGGAIEIADLMDFVKHFMLDTGHNNNKHIKYDIIRKSSRFNNRCYIFSNRQNQIKADGAIEVPDAFNTIHE